MLKIYVLCLAKRGQKIKMIGRILYWNQQKTFRKRSRDLSFLWLSDNYLSSKLM